MIKKAQKGVVAGGGSATAGGINFQAAVTAIIEIHIAAGVKLEWLAGIVNDIPLEVSAETGGAGDDIGILFEDGTSAEVQVKQGLSRGQKMWDALMKLARAVNDDIQYGILVICPNSSGTIKKELARDLVRLSGGRNDELKSISQAFIERMKAESLCVDKVAKRLRVYTVNASIGNGDSIIAAKAILRNICDDVDKTDHAWDTLLNDASQLIAYRGKRAADSVVQLLLSKGIALKSQGDAPSPLLAAFCSWMADTNSGISIPGFPKPLSLDDAWIELSVRVGSTDPEISMGVAEALEHYHTWAQGNLRESRDTRIIKGQTLGRFVRLGVVIGGPGMGKSTLLKKLARTYSLEGFPVLHFTANNLAQRMRATGCSFEEGIVALGTDGSGLAISPHTLRLASQMVILCDALDEAGSDQGIVIEGLLKFAAGYPNSRIIVTTRPIGYTSALLGEWRRYELQPLESYSVIQDLERIVCSVVDDSSEQEKTLAFAKEQINQSDNAKIAARSPLILGLISALAIKKIPFGGTRTQLYERLFKQMEKARFAPDVNACLTSVILSTFLDTFAWEILHDPTADLADLLQRCGEQLASALSVPSLNACMVAEKCFDYWERNGMVEMVKHAGVEAATFIHKTFGEYSAARYLEKMPPEKSRCEIETHITDKSWSEVLVFASSLGLIDRVLASYIKSNRFVTHKGISSALSTIIESDFLPSDELLKEVIEAATKYLISPISWEAISIGNKLLDLCHKYPQDVVSSTASYVNHEQPWTRIAVLAVMACTNSMQHDWPKLKEFLLDLPSLLDTVYHKSWGKFDFSSSPIRQFDALYDFAVREVLKLFSSEDVGPLLLPLLTRNYHGSSKGAVELFKILHEHKRADLAKEFDKDRMYEPLGNRFNQYWEPFNTPFSNFITALSVQLAHSDSRGILEDTTILWSLSGFCYTIGLRQQSYRDVWPSEISPDDKSIQEVLKGCVMASGVDPLLLSNDVASLVMGFAREKELPFSLFLFRHTEDVDIDMKWELAKGMDLLKLETALHYSSLWVVLYAAQLIEINATPEELTLIVTRVFDTGHGYALLVASELCLQLEVPLKSELLLDRLEKPLNAGCQYLFGALARLPLSLDQRLLSILRLGLRNSGPLTAREATRVAEKYVDAHTGVAILLQDAFNLWIDKEDPYSLRGGAIPDSPREEILKVLLKCESFEKQLLLRYVNDVRSDVSKVASDALLGVLKDGGGLCDEFLNGIENSELKSKLLKQALQQHVPLTNQQIHKICSFLSRPLPELRLDAMQILKSKYLSSAEVQERATDLLNDPDPEIRERARRMLED
ncbi:NACHT domain-containing protein [Candidatus Roizmanbacteria bacterium]|nr:NACHT domain-containing protein [Candidatus Roizmanbacteria bacterium]